MLVATGKEVKILDQKNGAELQVMMTDRPVFTAALNRTGNRLATTDILGNVRLLDVETGDVISTYEIRDQINELVLSDDAERLFYRTVDRETGFINTATKEVSGSFGNRRRDNSSLAMADSAMSRAIITNVGNNRVQKFDAHGNYLLQWCPCGRVDGQFRSPYGIAVDGSGDVFVADVSNHRLQKVDAQGQYP